MFSVDVSIHTITLLYSYVIYNYFNNTSFITTSAYRRLAAQLGQRFVWERQEHIYGRTVIWNDGTRSSGNDLIPIFKDFLKTVFSSSDARLKAPHV